ncbi:membrane protein [Pseudonocardia sp. Ae406_Ps2]|uniref:RND transporter n=1 Tax=unclassified Pseudonocardia TaxID=2619320 RepID=UPI00095CD0B8|nr:MULTISPECIES: RND transporter [unclassified Pseudonocardia]OLL98731.1 Membrane protein related to SecD/SecF [Pseudonocardia sp. Ae331_Ps2]OLM03531.1 membrane protein [Pseudonocardia sp. Ae406_Ps2]OLM11584.1 Membrane protein related to SecD/SecF [Pseudonocardia sp. Ae505_Ps2]OLM25088.1 membrane protein [Pseudonocardia sp. Ae706_Ps2]
MIRGLRTTLDGRGAASAASRPSGRSALVWIMLLALAALTVAGVSRVKVETGVESFLPSSDPSVQRYTELARSFGGDPIVVLLRAPQAPGLLDRDVLPHVLGLEGQLSQLPDVASVYGPATTLNQLASQSQKLLAELTGRRDGLQRAAAITARQRGEDPAAAANAAVAAFDARYGPLIVQGLPVGLPTLRNQRFIDHSIMGSGGEPRPQWRYVVPDNRSLAVLVRPREGLDQAGTEQLVAAVNDTVARAQLPAEATVSGVPAITASLGVAVDREAPVLGAVAVVAIGLCLFLVPWTRRRRRLIPLAVTLAATAATLAVLGWIGRPVSLGVVAFLPVLVGLGSYYPTYFARGARPRTVVVVAAGTAAGFGALLLSPLPFVRDLGSTLALGVAFAVALGWFVYRPGGWAGPDRPASAAPADPATDAAADPADPDPAAPDADPADAGAPAGDDAAAPDGPGPVARPGRSRLVAVVLAGLVAVGGWATLPFLPLQTSVDALSAGLPAVSDATRVEQILGSGGELAVVLRSTDGKGDVLTPQAWTWMTTAQQSIVRLHGDQARPALSAPTLLSFLGPTPDQEQTRAGVRLLPPYLTGAVLRPDGQVAVLSFGVRLDDLDRLRGLTDAITAELPPAPPGFVAEVSGLPAVAVQGYELVSADRYLAGTAGLVAAALVLGVGLRHRRDALRAALAAVLATGANLFLLWGFGIPLNPLTVALGSLTAAVGCEFTVMTCDAVRTRDPRLRTAVTLAALTSGTGFAVLALSDLALMREFGLLLALSVLLSYLAARVVVRAFPPAHGPADPARSTPAREKLVGVM